MPDFPRLEKGDTIYAYVKGDYCKVACYGMMKDGKAKVYVIHPDGTTDRMLYDNGNLMFNPVRKQRKKRDT